ncbi:hypothetical protein [Actinomadura roseirufa]|uniref:hypothetical protein n=1 Tax=Actinomadura roseirufa TaxID=2094049 RepID=UPI001041456B|nr:hypothetical protein [Actinomadura roseirufa]
MPRCTRCNAPLDHASAGENALPHEGPAPDGSFRPGGLFRDEATARDPGRPGVPYEGGRHEAAQHEGVPYEGGPPGGPPSGFGGADPLPPPWARQQEPPPWAASPADYTTPMPPSGETSTPLSPEPWAEPPMWQPPEQPKKSRRPYFLIAAGMLVLAAVALGIVLWPNGSGGSNGSATSAGDRTSAQPSEPEAPETEGGDPSPTAEGDALEKQAGTVEALLKEMAGTRSDLGAVVTAGCSTSGLQRVRDQRTEQLDKARGLEVGALLEGEEMKDALVRALQASVESNQKYLDAAPGCPDDDEVAGSNQNASDAKNEFIRLWTPNAGKAGITVRDADTI